MLLVLCIETRALEIIMYKENVPLRKKEFSIKKYLRNNLNSCKTVKLVLERSSLLISIISKTLSTDFWHFHLWGKKKSSK